MIVLLLVDFEYENTLLSSITNVKFDIIVRNIYNYKNQSFIEGLTNIHLVISLTKSDFIDSNFDKNSLANCINITNENNEFVINKSTSYFNVFLAFQKCKSAFFGQNLPSNLLIYNNINFEIANFLFKNRYNFYILNYDKSLDIKKLESKAIDLFNLLD